MLSGRLTVRLREEMGGSYSPNVRADTRRIPVGRCELTVAFDAPGDRIAHLTRATLEVVDSLRATPPTPTEVSDARETLRRDREAAGRTNRAWVEALADAVRYKEGVETRLLAGPLTFDAAALHRAAISHLDPLRYVQLSAHETVGSGAPAAAPSGVP